MNKKIFAVRDTKVSDFKFIHVADNEVMAMRGFEQGLREKDSIVAQYPEDHDLYRIGEVNTITGVITPENPPVLVVQAVALVQKYLSGGAK